MCRWKREKKAEQAGRTGVRGGLEGNWGTGGKTWRVGVGAKIGRHSIDWLDLLCI